MMQFLFTKTPLAYFVANFWRDEAFSYLMARLPIHRLFWSTAQDANPPLYYLLLKIWMGIFGTSEVALRSLSLIFFWATLVIIYLIMKDIYKYTTKKSLFYLLFFILNPLLHYYAFEARMYSMMAFLATLLFYAMMKKNYKLYAYTAIAALYTHYFLVVVIGFQVVFTLITTHKREWKHFIIPLLKTTLWYLPWVIVLLFARPPVGSSFWIVPSTWNDMSLLPAIILTGFEKDNWMIVPFISSISLIVSAIILFGAIHHVVYQKKMHFFLLLGWALGIPLIIFLLSFFKPVFLPRYLIFASVGMGLLLIVCLESIKNKYVRAALLTTVVSLLLSYTSIQVFMRTKAPVKKTFVTIKNEMRAGDVVYVTHEYDFHPAQYYLPTKEVYLYKKTYEELPWFVGKVLIDKKAFKEMLPFYPARAFIVNNDGSYVVQSLK
ncbi:MAG: glycosyltransferase family 39 protein [Candidatus Roizmanbacteria bacterium]|nr:glycosyltransferase family 39 protein [Candidatus Roizmanbacteria bacterium]